MSVFSRQHTAAGLALLLLLLPSHLRADPIIVPPPVHPSFQSIAANDAGSFNHWNGVGQSFTAEDPNVRFAFSMFNFSAGDASAVFSFYEGDGVFANLLAQRTVSVAPTTTPNFVEADFSSVDLIIGSAYTVVASMPGMGYPPSGSYSDIAVAYAATSEGPGSYAGGRFYFTGSPYDLSLPAFAERDIGFRVTPVSVPEPSRLVLLSALALVAVVTLKKPRREN